MNGSAERRKSATTTRTRLAKAMSGWIAKPRIPGLDKRSSLDSVQQALFFGVLTGKEPAVYDTDGQIGLYEHRIRVACERAGVRFMTAP